MEQQKFDLEDRLVKFACFCLEICELLPNTKSGQNLEYQLSKSSTSSALVCYFPKKCRNSKAEYDQRKNEESNLIGWAPPSLFFISY